MSLAQNIPIHTAAFLGHNTEDQAYQIAQGSSHRLALAVPLKDLEEGRRDITVSF